MPDFLRVCFQSETICCTFGFHKPEKSVGYEFLLSSWTWVRKRKRAAVLFWLALSTFWRPLIGHRETVREKKWKKWREREREKEGGWMERKVKRERVLEWEIERGQKEWEWEKEGKKTEKRVPRWERENHEDLAGEREREKLEGKWEKISVSCMQRLSHLTNCPGRVRGRERERKKEGEQKKKDSEKERKRQN